MQLRNLYPLDFTSAEVYNNRTAAQLEAMEPINLKYLINDKGLYGDFLYNQEDFLWERDPLP